MTAKSGPGEAGVVVEREQGPRRATPDINRRLSWSDHPASSGMACERASLVGNLPRYFVTTAVFILCFKPRPRRVLCLFPIHRHMNRNRVQYPYDCIL